jgi:hypothetical protein
VVTDFHIYALEWTEESLDFYVDDVLITRYINEKTGWEAWPFDVPFYLIMNLAVGGEWVSGPALFIHKSGDVTEILKLRLKGKGKGNRGRGSRE